MTQTFSNPFEAIEHRLANIENILSDLKRINNEVVVPSDNVEDIGGIILAGQITGLAKPTIYALVSHKMIPCMKKGKRLYFSRKELITWIQSGRKKTLAEKAIEVDSYLSAPKGKRK